MLNMAKSNYVEVVMLFSEAGAKKYFVSLTAEGEDFLMRNFDAATDAYHQHVAETILAMQSKMKERPYQPRPLSKREIAAIALGQEDMFGEG
ncbi:MAG: hypothetical protein L0287_28930 [Anaerolineae bacterium]|nr:hypothetical protein [Anaerolineae bacterium]